MVIVIVKMPSLMWSLILVFQQELWLLFGADKEAEGIKIGQ